MLIEKGERNQYYKNIQKHTKPTYNFPVPFASSFMCFHPLPAFNIFQSGLAHIGIAETFFCSWWKVTTRHNSPHILRVTAAVPEGMPELKKGREWLALLAPKSWGWQWHKMTQDITRLRSPALSFRWGASLRLALLWETNPMSSIYSNVSWRSKDQSWTTSSWKIFAATPPLFEPLLPKPV